MTIKNTIQAITSGSFLFLALLTAGCGGKSEDTQVATGVPATSAKPDANTAVVEKPAMAATPDSDEKLPDGWRAVKPDGGNFTIAMPGTPEKTADKSGGTDYTFKNDKDKTSFSVSMSDLSAQDQADVKDEAKLRKDLDEQCAQLVKELKGKELTREDITQNGWPGKTLKVEVPLAGSDKTLVAHFKFIFTNSKMLMFTFTGPGDVDYTSDTDQFYHSLKIAPKS